MLTQTSIHRHFGSFDDPRLARRKKFPWFNLIFIAFCAVVCGAEDWVSITRFGKARFNGLSQFIDLTNGIPSHDTFNEDQWRSKLGNAAANIAVINKMALSLLKNTLLIAGVGEVATHPEFHHCGLGRRLMNELRTKRSYAKKCTGIYRSNCV